MVSNTFIAITLSVLSPFVNVTVSKRDGKKQGHMIIDFIYLHVYLSCIHLNMTEINYINLLLLPTLMR